MPSELKYAIKIENVQLFYAGGGWKHSPEDATKFNTVEDAKARAVSLNKPGLVIVSITVNKPPENW
jgi:hypothetical protein